MGDPTSQSGRRAAAAGPSAAHLVDRRGHCRLAYEPIADLVRGEICGYEAVARFPEAIDPSAWRVEADRRGLDPDLDAFVLRSVLHARESLPADCFLSFNMRPQTLLKEPVRAALAAARRLDGLVVELCPRVPPRDEPRLVATVGELRAAGATIAVDDVGGRAGTLPHIVLLRPAFVKLDPELVAGLHRDDARSAIVELVGQLASRLDAWVVARGIEQIEELDALMRLRIPLAQGPLIGVRTKTLTPVAFVLSAYVRERGAAMAVPAALAALVERPPAIPHDPAALAAAFGSDPELRHVPILDAGGRPIGMAERDASERGEPPADETLRVAPSSRLPEVAQRAMLRPPATRFHPLVCCAADGRYLGIVRVERLVAALAHACEA